MKIDKERLLRIKRTPPLFIIGCQRSGTSFLYRALSEVLDIGFGRDSTLFIRLKKELPKYGDLNHNTSLQKLLNTIEETAIFRKRFRNLKINNSAFIDCLETREYSDIVRSIYAFWALQDGKTSWGGKTPDYTGHIVALNELFPDAKVIHVVRDGRDVALSFFEQPWGPKDIYVAAHYWKKRITNVNLTKENLEDRFDEIRYEDFLEDPVKIFGQILGFLKSGDLVLEDKVQEFKDKVVPKVMANNRFKWKKKLSLHDIRLFELVAGDILEQYDYEIQNKEYRGLSLPAVSIGYHYFINYFIKVKKGHIFRSIRRRAFSYRY